MNSTAAYLSVLSKIMQEDKSEFDQGSDLFNNLFNTVNDELSSFLSHSHYSNAPLILEKMNAPLQQLENFLLCPEMQGHFNICLSGVAPGLTLGFMTTLFSTPLPKVMRTLWMESPIILSNCDHFELLVVTYAGKRVPFRPEQLVLLTNEAKKRKLDLKTVIKYIIISNPLKIDNTTFILDNYAEFGYRLFSSFVDNSVHFVNRIPDERLLHRLRFSKNKRIVVPDDLKTALSSMELIGGHDIIPISKLSEWLEASIIHRYYGIKGWFTKYEAQIITYYETQISRDEKLVQLITDDLINLKKGDDNLRLQRNDITERIEKYRTEYQELKRILDRLDNCINDIEQFLDNTVFRCDSFLSHATDDLLSEIFVYAESAELQYADNTVKRLKQMNYSEINLVEQYITSISEGKTVDISQLGDSDSWTKSKMLIQIADLSNANAHISKLSKWIKFINRKNASTGKELYVFAITNSSNKKIFIRLLTDSFSLGYFQAGELLIEEYNKTKSQNISLRFLAKSLYPEACILLGNQELQDTYPPPNSIGSKAMMYYKLAASQGNTEAIKRIIDMLYEPTFNSTGTSLSGRKKRIAEMLINLCDYLINMHIDEYHYSEISGLLYFQLGHYSQAFRLLSGKNTKHANYCKGWMFEKGKGTTQDYSQALSHYQKADGISDASQCVTRVQVLIDQQKKAATKQQANTYSENKTYKPEVINTTTKKDSWCFITTAVTLSLGKKDDCDELNIMRRFRDAFIVESSDNACLVQEYYRIAPIIVQKINALSNADSIYLSLWQKYIHPCILAIDCSNPSKAVTIYLEMVKDLSAQYEVPISESIQKRIVSNHGP